MYFSIYRLPCYFSIFSARAFVLYREALFMFRPSFAGSPRMVIVVRPPASQTIT
jgi:hypothetical protein